jgi:hypothetical protein
MSNKVLAKLEFGPNEAPDVAELRRQILYVLRQEYGDGGIWAQAAERSTSRIMAALERQGPPRASPNA